jgi:hypothetical protein
LIWTHGIGGGGASGSSGGAAGSSAGGEQSVAIDGSGNIYAVGAFGGTINLGNDAAGSAVTLTVPVDGGTGFDYLVKYAPGGTVLWAQEISGHSTASVVADPQGDFLFDASFGGTTTVGGKTLSYTNGNDYVAKIGPDGTFAWVDQFAASIPGVAIDASGNAYLTGEFTGTLDFDPGAGTYKLFSGGNSKYPAGAAYVEKLNASGTMAWAVALQGSGSRRNPTGNAAGIAVAVDGAGNVYTTGSYGGTVDFNPSSTATYNLPDDRSGAGRRAGFRC